MRKVSLLLIISMILLSMVNKAQVTPKKKNDLLENGYKDKVRQVEVAPYYSKKKSGQIGFFGLILESVNNHKLTKYDEYGNKIEEVWFCLDERFNEVVEGKYTYRHDSIGNTIEENHFNITDHLIERKVFKYDDNGNWIEMNYFHPEDKLVTRITSKYDTIGRTVELTSYNSKLKAIIQNTFNYNKLGKCTEIKSFDFKGELIGHYRYEENGNRIINKKDKFSRRFFPSVTEYDAEGILTEIKFYNSNKNPFKKYIYRKNGILSEIKEYDTKYRQLYSLTSDENGNFSGFFDSKGEKKGMSVNEYDSHGNITRQIISYKNKPKFIINWEYTYY